MNHRGLPYYPLSQRLVLECEDRKLKECGNGKCSVEQFSEAIETCNGVRPSLIARLRWWMKWHGWINPFVGEP